MSNRIFWITTPQEERLVTQPKAHLSYQISNGRLLRGPLPENTYGGIMAISLFELSAVDHNLISALTEECSLFGYRAVFAAVDDSVNERLASVFEALGAKLTARGLPLIVPVSYQNHCKNVSYCAPTSISGGALNEYLDTLLDKIDASKLYLEHRLTQTKFTMPSLSGDGIFITEDERDAILSSADVQAFYSPELFLNYCTYRQEGVPHFLLFDDERTLRAKLDFGTKLGVAGQFLLYRELKNFYPLL